MVRPMEGEEASRYRIEEKVWVKPPSGTCTTRWTQGKITGLTSSNTVSVDGVPRHVLDLRRVFEEDDELDAAVPEEVRESQDSLGIIDLFEHLDEPPGVPEEVGQEEGVRVDAALESRPARTVRPPRYLEEYEW